MKKMILLILALTIVLGLCACGTNTASKEKEPETIVADSYFYGGTIYTADDNDTFVEAVAVKDGKIVFAGNAEEGAPYKNGAIEVIDLQGKMLFPAFGEDHCHIMPPSYWDINFVPTTDARDELIKEMNQKHPEYNGNISYPEAVEEYIMDYAIAHPEKDTIQGIGYNTEFFEGDWVKTGLTKIILDRLGENGPVIQIYDYTGHNLVMNSKCQNLCGITKDTPDPFGGVIIKDEITGEPLGTLKDSAMSLALDLSTLDTQVAAITEFQEMYNTYGIVNIMNVSGNGFAPCPMDGAKKMDEEGSLTVRLRSAFGITYSNYEKDIENAIAKREQYQGNLFAVNTAKFFIDGQPFTLEDYPAFENYHGTCCWKTEEALADAILKLHEADFQCHFHTYADRAVQWTLNGIEKAYEQYPDKDLRHTLAHLMTMTDEDIARMAKYNCVAAFQPSWFFKEDPGFEVNNLPTFGEEAEKMYKFKSCMDAGVITCGGSDYPVSPSYQPLLGIQIGVTRNDPAATNMDDPSSLLNVKERASVSEMIKAYTINIAKEMFCEDVTGSIEVGKSADLVILSEDLFSIDPMKISEVTVEKTYLMGNEVYSK